MGFILNNGDIDILACSETWLDDSFPEGILTFNDDFSVVRKDRSRKIGGGVLFLIRKNIKFFHVDDFSVNFIHCSDVLALDLFSKNGKIRLILVYRPPSETVDGTRQLVDQLEALIPLHHLVICGDFNLPKLNYSDPCYHRDVSHTVFYDFFVRHHLFLKVSDPTRVSDGCSSVLDLIFTDVDELVANGRVGDVFSTSDHCIVYSSLNFSKTSRKAIFKYDFFKADFDKINHFLFGVNWDLLFQGCFDLDEMYSIFVSVIFNVFRDYIPRKRFGDSKKCHYSPVVKKLFRKKLVLWRKFKKSRNSVYSLSYAAISKKLRNRLLVYRSSLEEGVVRSKNPRVISKFVRSQLKAKIGIEALNCDGYIIFDDKRKAAVFSDYFSANFNIDDCSNPDPFKLSLSALENFEIDPYIVFTYLDRLEPKISCTPEGIPQLFLKRCALSLALPLSLIFKRSLRFGQIPNPWKEAIITPVFKKGRRDLVSNYRPVSLTSAVCRVFERIICFHILNHLNFHKLLCKEQFGFVKRKSCLTQLLLTFNDWFSMLKRKMSFDCVYIDFRKAFDHVIHRKLLIKLDSYGIKGDLLNWISSYLLGRSQKVLVGHSYSEKVPVTSGVPQGSVLGPLLFNIYINDLPLLMPDNVAIKLFADDVKLYCDDYFCLQNALNEIFLWSKIWQLEIAADKTFFLHFGSGNIVNTYSIGGCNILRRSDVRDLGLNFDDNLNFSVHVARIASLANNRARQILRVFRSLNVSSYIALYKTYVRPLLEYASEIFNPVSSSLINMLERPQRFFTRIVFKRASLPSVPYLQRLNYLSLDTLEFRRAKQDLITFFKCVYGISDTEGFQLLPPRNFRSSRNHNIRFFQQRIVCSRFWFVNRIIPVWNKLPAILDDVSSVNDFKNMLKLLRNEIILRESNLRV